MKEGSNGDVPAGNAPSDSAKADVIEPSQLISRSEAEEILGVSLGNVENTEQPAAGMKQCVYQSEESMLQIAVTQQALMKQGQTPETNYAGYRPKL